MTKQDILQKCTIEDMVVKLPDVQLDRKIYLEVAKSLNLIGGKWKGGKIAGFVFQQDPTDLLKKIAGGEKVNLKKQYQFFATPDSLADELVELAEIAEDSNILEPSAGQGAIIKAINREFPSKIVDCYELMDVNQVFLSKIDTANLISEDFIKANGNKKYSTIIANPPFSKNQDILHIMHMYDLLESKGRLVSITSKHWQLSNNKKETKFREWLDEVGAEVQEIEAGAFKESGTNISACIIIINKI